MRPVNRRRERRLLINRRHQRPRPVKWVRNLERRKGFSLR